MWCRYDTVKFVLAYNSQRQSFNALLRTCVKELYFEDDPKLIKNNGK